jgi:multiple sugar transport system ATP-binding protein
MADIVLDHITKRYPDGYEAVKDMDLKIDDGEFIILVGPSGCGKSTALRMIAGLEDITDGDLRIGGEVVNQKAPKDRDIAMVFQNYALYPHMTVRENMGFALKLAKAPKEEINQKVEEAARILDLEQHLDRKPANLSGGQRQRVAMGRAIVRNPSAFLMDEPLSNLDAKLRVQMRTEVSRIQSRLGTTTVYVTHDQTEAMTLGDRVAVMRAGVLQQVAKPGELYNRPRNLFVAGFIGSPAMNFLPAQVQGDRVSLPIGDVPLGEEQRRAIQGAQNGNLIAGLRPEDFEDASLVGDQRDRGVVFKAKIDVVESLGPELYVYFTAEHEGVSSKELEELAQDAGTAEVPSAGEGQVVARLEAASQVQEGQELELWYDASKLHLFDAESGRSLLVDTSE